MGAISTERRRDSRDADGAVRCRLRCAHAYNRPRRAARPPRPTTCARRWRAVSKAWLWRWRAAGVGSEGGRVEASACCPEERQGSYLPSLALIEVLRARVAATASPAAPKPSNGAGARERRADATRRRASSERSRSPSGWRAQVGCSITMGGWATNHLTSHHAARTTSRGPPQPADSAVDASVH